jgi:protein-L-isoaspartate(D-aspartate) O-methyltransferase
LQYRDLADNMVQRQLASRDIHDAAVLEAMRCVPRHLFVPDIDPPTAYSDRALPTGAAQTISQPYIVARMIQLLRPRPAMRVLEIGTGSGYQAAVLAQLGMTVVTIERIEELAREARQRLDRIMPHAAIQVITGDGSIGYPPAAPYDGIIVTAAAPRIPEAYREQLVDGGRVVIPLGNRRHQTLSVVQRRSDRMEEQTDLACRFVPLIGADAWEDEQSSP